MEQIEPGMKVTALYKTGKYIGEAEQIKNGKVLVSVLSVLKHPRQGDLHNPNQSDVPFFHQRKALALHEKTWAPIHTVKPFDGEIPDYSSSLKAAFEEHLLEVVETDNQWAQKSLEELKKLKKEYKL
ncbi:MULTISPECIES: sporulation phosphorelay system protein KapB [unclassified Fictibacillus]|uniref:sporulation phosphorelay system protein KapB n=1 Tax=unclassified Fictibacillus TaxID=2644029 RepID=UPI000782E1BC|nr:MULTISPECIES: sporulation phosphorelay system protein KapB [unclassified Fictibacillus]MED2973111.1 sporulation phosphorelay system protein KapB [Fictibacillus sp. B-59209]UZJ76969.1 kinase-associated lipoprotein B [Fictibacillus sp. KU28468]SFD91661.1 kinase-associated protein B [Bacillus sp. OV194]